MPAQPPTCVALSPASRKGIRQTSSPDTCWRNGIGTALDDLEAGRIGLVIKLFPVISWLTRERPDLAVAMQVPTHEQLGIAYAPERVDLCDAVDAAIEALHESGEFAKLQAAWPGTGATVGR